MKNIIEEFTEDVNHVGEVWKSIEDALPKIKDALPWVAGATAVLATSAKTAPLAKGITKATVAATKAVSKGLAAVGSAGVGKMAAAPAAVYVGGVVERKVYKTPSTPMLIGSLVSGNLTEADQKLLSRKKFRLSDIVSGHFTKRVVARVLRPSWFK